MMTKLDALIVGNRLLFRTTEGRKIDVICPIHTAALLPSELPRTMVLVCVDEKMSAHAAHSCLSVRGVIRVLILVGTTAVEVVAVGGVGGVLLNIDREVRGMGVWEKELHTIVMCL
jgi:hypothetical protein